MSADGYDLVYHFPGGISPKAKKVLTDLLIDYGEALDIKVTPTADKFHRNNPNSYIEKRGEVAGVVHLVRCWHGIGRPDLDMVISRDFTKSGKAFSKSLELLDELQVFSRGINSFLQNIDPIQHASLEAARTRAEEKYTYVKLVDSVDPLLMEGRAVMWNRMTPDHKDTRDPEVAWAALAVLGQIKSGWLIFRQLNLKVRYRPGDIVWLRGAILDHEVDVWEGEQRISIAHFTHKSYFDDLNVTCLTARGAIPTDPPTVLSGSFIENSLNRKRKRNEMVEGDSVHLGGVREADGYRAKRKRTRSALSRQHYKAAKKKVAEALPRTEG
ncbi:hypothetical protein GYMLUDRAFT_244177 [Collybiopsis luxurians FD-317 M1]|uniref:Uncharacterized protein n=1 Tax=Collybiopsis luxurians FD-317 M1 TaxID=944289 RepID=A0A0D0CWT9_9AGAR|nr:hypothetical protein GYMLUDRAFT_244177 [Collybiopsis luxurians FD-317 M1]